MNYFCNNKAQYWIQLVNPYVWFSRIILLGIWALEFEYFDRWFWNSTLLLPASITMTITRRQPRVTTNHGWRRSSLRSMLWYSNLPWRIALCNHMLIIFGAWKKYLNIILFSDELGKYNIIPYQLWSIILKYLTTSYQIILWSR